MILTTKQFNTLLAAPFAYHEAGWFESIARKEEMCYTMRQMKELHRGGYLRRDGRVMRVTHKGLDYVESILEEN